MSRFARLAFLAFALVLAGVVSFMSYRMMSEKEQGVVMTKAPEVKMQQIAVAARDIPRGHKLSQEDIRFTGFLVDSSPVGTFSPDKSPVDRVAMTNIQATVPIIDSQLASSDIKNGGLAAIVSADKRAMSVSVDKVIGIAGFVHPGHMVDVLVSIGAQGEKEGFITKIVLENILVLAIGTQDQETPDKKSIKVNVVTLEVTPEESERLALARDKGAISLALRGYSDKEVVFTRGATVPELLQNYRTEKLVAVAAPPNITKSKAVNYAPPKKKFVVEVMNGSSLNSITIEGR